MTVWLTGCVVMEGAITDFWFEVEAQLAMSNAELTIMIIDELAVIFPYSLFSNRPNTLATSRK